MNTSLKQCQQNEYIFKKSFKKLLTVYESNVIIRSKIFKVNTIQEVKQMNTCLTAYLDYFRIPYSE